jgi:hypothetical protein
MKNVAQLSGKSCLSTDRDTNIENTGRYLEVEIDVALTWSERTDIRTVAGSPSHLGGRYENRNDRQLSEAHSNPLNGGFGEGFRASCPPRCLASVERRPCFFGEGRHPLGRNRSRKHFECKLIGGEEIVPDRRGSLLVDHFQRPKLVIFQSVDFDPNDGSISGYFSGQSRGDDHGIAIGHSFLQSEEFPR